MASCGIAKWLLLLSTIEIVAHSSQFKTGSIGGTYKFAQKLYGQGNVFPALKTFEAAFRNHLYREDVELNCQLECAEKEEAASFEEEAIEARAFESLFAKTLCLENCFEENNAAEMNRASGNSKTELDNRFVYHYLHFLYNEIGEGKEAMNLVWTYLQKFPKNSDMLSNYFLYLDLYPELSRASSATFLDYDESALDKIVKQLVQLYNARDYASLPPLVDAALDEYFQQQENCKLRCFLTPEKSTHNFGLSIFLSLFEQERNALECKRSCAKIKSPYGIFSDFLVKFFVQEPAFRSEFSHFSLKKSSIFQF